LARLEKKFQDDLFIMIMLDDLPQKSIIDLSSPIKTVLNHPIGTENLPADSD
jgi:hypothetical protein